MECCPVHSIRYPAYTKLLNRLTYLHQNPGLQSASSRANRLRWLGCVCRLRETAIGHEASFPHTVAQTLRRLFHSGTGHSIRRRHGIVPVTTRIR
jgi:hypothetical protein